MAREETSTTTRATVGGVLEAVIQTRSDRACLTYGTLNDVEGRAFKCAKNNHVVFAREQPSNIGTHEPEWGDKMELWTPAHLNRLTSENPTFRPEYPNSKPLVVMIVDYFDWHTISILRRVYPLAGLS